MLRLGMALAPHAWENDDLGALAGAGRGLLRLAGHPHAKLYDVCHRYPPNRWPPACARPWPFRRTPANTWANRPEVERHKCERTVNVWTRFTRHQGGASQSSRK